MSADNSTDRLIPVREAAQLCGISRATIYRWVAENRFPSPVRIGGRAVRWRINEVTDWIASRPIAA